MDLIGELIKETDLSKDFTGKLIHMDKLTWM